MALVKFGKDGKSETVRAPAIWNRTKKVWEQMGDSTTCTVGKTGVKYPCQLQGKVDLKTGAPLESVQPDGTWKYSMEARTVSENKLLKQKILNQIKSLLNEDIQNITPETHQSYLRKLAQWAQPYGLNEDPEKIISMMDRQLKAGASTKQVYDTLVKNAPVLGGFFEKNPPPPNYTWNRASQASATPDEKTMQANVIGNYPNQIRIWCGMAKQTLANKDATPEQKQKAMQDIKTYKCDQQGQSGGAAAPKKYFICKQPGEVEATKKFQESKGLNPDGKIGKGTFAEILLDPTIKSAGVDFAEKGIKISQVIGNADPKMKDIYQRSVCEALAKTGAAWISGGKKLRSDRTGVNIDTTQLGIGPESKQKCPSFMKPNGPYTFEEIQGYVANFVQSGGDYQQRLQDPLVFKVANTVTTAIKNNSNLSECEMVVQLIKGAIKTKGASIPGLSKIETPEQTEKSSEMDKLNTAREYAKKGTPEEDIDDDVVAVGKKYGVKFKKRNPGVTSESKNWLDRTREGASTSLFERLVKDVSKKKVI